MIDVANLEVTEYRFRGRWHKPKTRTTVRRAIETAIASDI